MKNLFRDFKLFIRKLVVLVNTPPAYLPPHCCNINALLLHLCDHDHDLHKWVLRWIAYPLRHPGAKMSTCPVFTSGDAAGKSMFFGSVLMGLYGASARRIHTSVLRCAFNDWVVGARLVIVDGAYTSSLIPLKPLVTQDRILVTQKAQPERTEPNHMNIVFLSGCLDFLPAAVSDRRFFVVEVPPPQSPMFYRAVHDEIHNGGIEAFQQYLLHELDMGDFEERTRPPEPRVAPVRASLPPPLRPAPAMPTVKPAREAA